MGKRGCARRLGETIRVSLWTSTTLIYWKAPSLTPMPPRRSKVQPTLSARTFEKTMGIQMAVDLSAC